MSSLSDMSFIVSSSIDSQQQHYHSHSRRPSHPDFVHGKYLVMNGTPRSSSQQQRLPSLDVLSKDKTAPVNGAPSYSNGVVHESPIQTCQPSSTHSRLSSEASQSYPPPNASRQASATTSAESTLKVPDPATASKRRSSPTRFHSYPHQATTQAPPASLSLLSSSAPTNPDSFLNPPTPRLQHRHTLEVPRVSGSRTSREYRNDGTHEDGAAARLSTSTAPRFHRGSLNLGRRISRSNYSDTQLDDAAIDGDASRWTEAMRQKRASRRRRKEEEDDDRVVVGTKVDQNHANWVTAYNMLTGIRFTVSRTNAKLDRDLTDADFETRHKFSFDMYAQP